MYDILRFKNHDEILIAANMDIKILQNNINRLSQTLYHIVLVCAQREYKWYMVNIKLW